MILLEKSDTCADRLKSFQFSLVLVFVAAFGFGMAGSANAAPVGPIPNYSPDAGDSYFVPTQDAGFIISVEVADVDSIQATSSFGFYFWDDPGNLITIFDPTDQASDPNDANTFPSAFVSFKDGIVFDFDANVVQDNFTPTLNPSSFGFFLTVLGETIYSDPTRNAGGVCTCSPRSKAKLIPSHGR